MVEACEPLSRHATGVEDDLAGKMRVHQARQLQNEPIEGYCQLKSHSADFLPRASNPNAEQSMSDEFVYGLILVLSTQHATSERERIH